MASGCWTHQWDRGRRRSNYHRLPRQRPGQHLDEVGGYNDDEPSRQRHTAQANRANEGVYKTGIAIAKYTILPRLAGTTTKTLENADRVHRHLDDVIAVLQDGRNVGQAKDQTLCPPDPDGMRTLTMTLFQVSATTKKGALYSGDEPPSKPPNPGQRASEAGRRWSSSL